MKIKSELSLKKVALSKANVQIVAYTSAAAFITVFCLVAANYFLGIRSYQSKIITADNIAYNQLKADVTAKNKLVSDYENFVQQSPNILGSANTNSGYIYNNATIILDALPSRYDFPALTSTIAKILQSGNFNVTAIGGTDASATTSNAASSNPQPVAIPFSFTITNTSYQSIQGLFQLLQNSIRPMQIDNITLSGTDASMTLTVSAHTYFQPGKEFKISTETIAP